MKESGADQWKLVIPLPFPAFVLAVRELLSIRVVPNVCNNPIPRPLKACMLLPVGNRGCWLCNRPAPFIIDKQGILQYVCRGSYFGVRPSIADINAELKKLSY